jgi:hypothetical protein
VFPKQDSRLDDFHVIGRVAFCAREKANTGQHGALRRCFGEFMPPQNSEPRLAAATWQNTPIASPVRFIYATGTLKRLHALTRRLFAAVTARECGFAECSREFRSTPKADIRLRFNIGRDGPIASLWRRSNSGLPAPYRCLQFTWNYPGSCVCGRQSRASCRRARSKP